MVEKTATIRNAHGIHCRPSSVIMKAAKGYLGTIMITADVGETDLTSIYGLLCLGLQVGQQVRISVTGPDEAAVCDQLVTLFETKFDFPPREGGAAPLPPAAGEKESDHAEKLV